MVLTYRLGMGGMVLLRRRWLLLGASTEEATSKMVKVGLTEKKWNYVFLFSNLVISNYFMISVRICMSVGVIQTCLNNSCSNFVEGTYNHALCETSPTWPSQRDVVWAPDLREKDAIYFSA